MANESQPKFELPPGVPVLHASHDPSKDTQDGYGIYTVTGMPQPGDTEGLDIVTAALILVLANSCAKLSHVGYMCGHAKHILRYIATEAAVALDAFGHVDPITPTESEQTKH
jgi:hypothetical protein